MLAIRFGDEATVRDLVATAPRPLLPRDLLGPPIRLAAEFGRVEIVRVLLEADEDPTDGLAAAVGHGHLDAVRLLTQAGARIDEPTEWTLLMVAADGGFDQVVDHLLRRGANRHLRSKTTDGRWNNQTPLELAKARVAAGVESPGRDYPRVIELLRSSASDA